MTIHLFPIEPIEERYSADWERWWPAALQEAGFRLHVYEGERLPSRRFGKSIHHGQFLDALDTHYYKSTQLADFIKAVDAGEVKDGDVVLLLDGWNPAVTSLAYIRAIAEIRFKIVLVLHAGTWDPHDHLTQRGMGEWAKHVELGWIRAADRVLVATEFHEAVLRNYFGEDFRHVKVTGFPLVLSELDQYKTWWSMKEQLVVNPHRLAPEKQPQVFGELQRMYEERYGRGDVEWVNTQEVYTDKPSLYRLLARAKVAFSAALQETWGIVQLESWYLGCMPVVPRRLSYQELYHEPHFYTVMENAVEKVHFALTKRTALPEFNPHRDPRVAFVRIIGELESL